MAKLKISQTTWNLKPLFQSDTDPKIEKELVTIKKESYKFINKWKDRNDYLRDPKVLKEALDKYENWSKLYGTTGKQGYYFGLRTAQDQTNPKTKARINKLNDFGTKILNDIQFFTMRIAKIPKEEQKEFLNSPVLKEYKHFLETSFEVAKYLLSEPEEKIMNLKEKTSLSNWVRMVSEFISKEEREILDEKGKKAKKSFSEILSLTSNKNRKVRKSAAKALEEIFEKHLDVAEAEINTVLENQKVNDELRGYPRPDSRRHLADDIDTEVVDTLIKTASSRFNTAKKFYELKAKLLDVSKVEYYERSVEYGKIDKKFSYEKAINLINEVFENLDEEFANILKTYVRNAQFDAFPRKGKRGGAFCTGSGILDPTYILLNHTNRLNDVLTIAHEVGHGINNELIKAKQNELNFGTPTSTAEVASTFMEDFVLQRLLRDADDEEKLAIMMMKLDNDIATIFRQIAFYKFEQELHQKFRKEGYLTKAQIGKLFKKHMKTYMGSSGENSDNWWVYVSHFRAFFYVYSYASGLLISKSLQNSVKENPKFVKKVKEFLAAGMSDSPKNIFKRLGVDITDAKFWSKGLDEVDLLLEETEKLARKLGKV